MGNLMLNNNANKHFFRKVNGSGDINQELNFFTSWCAIDYFRIKLVCIAYKKFLCISKVIIYLCLNDHGIVARSKFWCNPLF